jgi:hypothetical protein
MAGHEGSEFLSERLDALLQGIALPRQCDFGSGIRAGLGNTPRYRTVVCYAEDDAALACHEASGLSHILLP